MQEEYLRPSLHGVETGGWLVGSGGEFSWHPVSIIRAGVAAAQHGSHSVGLDLDEIEREVGRWRRTEGPLRIIGDWHTQPTHSDPSPADVRGWAAHFKWHEREHGLSRYVGVIVRPPDLREGRYQPARYSARITRRAAPDAYSAARGRGESNGTIVCEPATIACT
jgi:hypothetical protein